jgi:hypothetical protein
MDAMLPWDAIEAMEPSDAMLAMLPSEAMLAIDQALSALAIEPALAAEAIEPALAAEAMLPAEATDAMEPTLPCEVMEEDPGMTGGYCRVPSGATVGAMTDADRETARKRVKARRDFSATTAILVVIAAILIVIWFVTNDGHGYFWPMWPLIGFAIAIVFSGLNAFGVINRDVTDGDIDAEIDRMKRRS